MNLTLSAAAGHAERSGTAVLLPLRQVSERAGNNGLAEHLTQIQTWLSDDLAELEASLANLHTAAEEQSEQANIAERAADHLLGRRGKRIRPMCVLLAARLGRGADPRQVRNAAVASELVHAATLLHDDVIDEGVDRRGALTARVVYGNSASILAGDHLLIEALRLVRQSGHIQLLDQLLNTVSEMVAAEALQLERRGRFEPDRATYLRIIEGKTAALFRWALAAGGTLGSLPLATTEILGRAGLALGLAFQLIDDVLDLEGSEAATGKSVLADLREGKLTWPLIVATERDPDLLAELGALAEGNGTNEATARLWKVVERVRRTEALEATRTFAEEQTTLARSLLAVVPDSPARRAVEIVIDAAVQRDH